MPVVDLRKYADIQFFQYSLRTSLTALQSLSNLFVKINADSDFLVQKITGNATGNYNILINDTGQGRNFFSGAVRNDLIVGTAQRPNILIHPRLLFANSQLNFTLTDLSNGANTIEIVLEGIKLYKQLPAGVPGKNIIDLSRYNEVDYFLYQFAPTTVTANSFSNVNVAIQADSDFLIQKLAARSTGTFRSRITDAGTNRAFQDNLLDNADIYGTAQQPNVLLYPQLINANSNIITELQDTSGNSNTIEIITEGLKLFKR